MRKLVASVGVLTAGSLVGQAILALGFILLTTLYSPAQIGALSVLLAIAALGAVVLSGRLETFISLHQDESTLAAAVDLARRQIRRRAALSLPVLFAGLLLLASQRPLLIAILIVSSLWAMEQVAFQLAIRLGFFTVAASANLVRPIVMIAAAAALAPLSASSESLFAAAALSRLASLSTLRLTPKGHELSCATVSNAELETEATQFSRRQVPIAFTSSANQTLPVVLVASLFGDIAAGLFALAYRLTASPMLALAAAARNVLAREIARSPGREAVVIRRAFVLTSAGAVALTSAALLLLPFLEERLSTDWEGTAQLGSVLAILVGFRFVVSPLSQVLIALKRQPLLLRWHLLNLSMMVASLTISSISGLEIQGATIALTIVSCLSYILLAALIFRSLREHESEANIVT